MERIRWERPKVFGNLWPEGDLYDLITVLQIKARTAEDTGERLTLDEFAGLEGFDLAQLRPAE